MDDSEEETAPVFKYDVVGAPLGSYNDDEADLPDVRPAAFANGALSSDQEKVPAEPISQQALSADGSDIGEYLSLEDFDEVEVQADAVEDDQDLEVDTFEEDYRATAYVPPPWARASVKRGLVRSPLLRLHQEIIDFCDFLAATDDERSLREAAVERVKGVIHSIWPLCTPTVFGSYATGLFLPTSDMDMVVLESGVDNVPNALRALSVQLSKRRVAKQIQVIAKARVPIIKFVEVESKIQFDISFDVENGPAAANFIRESMKTLPPLRPLCLVVKIFLQQRELNEVYTGGIGSYALIVMLMAHLQLHPSRRGYESGGSQAPLDSNLGVLLIDFFELYGKMLNVRDVGVSCKDGGAFFCKRESGTFNRERPFLLSVQDPQDEQNDIGKNSYNVQKVRSAFMHAHALLTTEGDAGQGLLERIVRMDKILLKRKVGSPAPVSLPEIEPHGCVSSPQGAYEEDLNTVGARPSSKRAREGDTEAQADSRPPKEGVRKKRQKVETENESEEEESVEVREESPEEGQIDVERPKKKKKKMRPAKVRRMKARQEQELVNAVVGEQSPGSPAIKRGRDEKQTGQRRVLNTGKGLVVVSPS